MPETRAKAVPLLYLIVAAFVAQVIQIPNLWGHVSTGGSILGRYSPGYASFLGLTLLVALIWLGLLIRYQHVQVWLYQTVSTTVSVALVVLSGAGLIVISLSGIEEQIVQYLALNWALFSVILLYPLNDAPRLRIYFYVLFTILAVLIGLIVIVATLTAQLYTPDEAIWANIASSYRVAGGLFYRAANYMPLSVAPGLGWIHVVHGELQWLFDFDVRIARAFNLAFKGLGCLALWLLSDRLYGRAAAWTVVLLTVIGSEIFRAFEYRPDHFLIFGQAITFFCVVMAWQAKRRLSRLLWHMLAGLLITLSMQLHAIALGFILGISLFYVLDFALTSFRQRRICGSDVQVLVAFGLGALLGSGFYYYANIASVGGLDVYLSILVGERGSADRQFKYLIFWSQIDLVLLYGSLAFLIWRRTVTDQRYLALLACSVIGITLIDTQGYLIPLRGLFLVPMGVMLAQGFPQKRLWVLAIILVALVPQTVYWARPSAVWSVLQQGGLPEIAVEQLGRTILENVPLRDEVVVATHELTWVMPDYPRLYTPGAEGLAPKQYGWEGVEVWNNLKPDIYIEIPARQETPPGLRAYLEQEGFQVCQQFSAINTPVIVYRRDCSVG